MSKSCVLVTPESHESLGENINGPTLIRVPSWVKNPLGRYYLYFAHHYGKYIRLAFGDAPDGPFTVYPQGVLPLSRSLFSDHIASPDLHIDHEHEEILLLHHGLGFRQEHGYSHEQLSACAVSRDGLHFENRGSYLGPPYLRFVPFDGGWMGMAGDGSRRLFRGATLSEPFEAGPQLPILGEDFDDVSEDMNRYRMRHCALDVSPIGVFLYYSNVGDAPERIKRTRLRMEGDWERWHGEKMEEVRRPESFAEGADLPVERSFHGDAPGRVCALRDPFVFRENDSAWLYYSIAGESGLAVESLRD